MYLSYHTSKINDLCSSLNSEETLQNFLYLYKKKTDVVFLSFFNLSNFYFLLMSALVYVIIVQGIHKMKIKVAQIEKRKKKLHGSSFYINIGNFESFLQNLNLSANNSFWRYDMVLFRYT